MPMVASAPVLAHSCATEREGWKGLTVDQELRACHALLSRIMPPQVVAQLLRQVAAEMFEPLNVSPGSLQLTFPNPTPLPIPSLSQQPCCNSLRSPVSTKTGTFSQHVGHGHEALMKLPTTQSHAGHGTVACQDQNAIKAFQVKETPGKSGSGCAKYPDEVHNLKSAFIRSNYTHQPGSKAGALSKRSLSGAPKPFTGLRRSTPATALPSQSPLWCCMWGITIGWIGATLFSNGLFATRAAALPSLHDVLALIACLLVVVGLRLHRC